MAREQRPELFRYRAGRRGHNRVTVYRRTPDGPIQVEWFPHGRRRRETLRNLTGQPVYDERLAVAIADAMAAKLEHATRREQARAILGLPEPHTLKELLDAYHAKRGPGWSASNGRHQKIMRRFWLDRLGETTDVLSLAAMAADIERIVHDEARRRKWSSRTQAKYLKYLVTAFNFGRRKLKWFGQEHDLSAVDIPRPDSQAASYTTDEIRRLLPALETVDIRAGVAGHVAYVSLRRITAIRWVTRDPWRTQAVALPGGVIERVGYLRFGAEHDKARKTGEVALAGRALELVERLREMPAVRASGLLLPAGDLHDPAPDRHPVSYELLLKWLHEAERRAGVQRVKGRSWHAFKRAAATDAEQEMGDLAAASEQAGTLRSTLERHYLRRDPRLRAELAVRLARRVQEA